MPITENAKQVLEKRYLSKDETGKVQEDIPGMFRRVAHTVAQAERAYVPKEDRSLAVINAQEAFYKMMSELNFLPNSPTLMNAGRPLGQLSACFVLPVEDSMDGIFDSIKNTAIIQKSGGGTGFSFSRLRSTGSTVRSTGGVASGPVSFMKAFNSATETVKQGGTRRGANMGILRVDHPDILEFITCKNDTNELNNFNLSIGVTEAFMKAVAIGADYELVDPHSKKVTSTLNAKDVFQKIVDSAWQNGEPGIVFLDRINRDNPTPDLGEIESTNPCVEGSTRVLTDKGYFPIKEIAEKGGPVRVWNGECFSEVTPRETGRNQQMTRVVFSDGSTLICTLYHKFILTDGTRVDAKDLRKGMELVQYDLPVMEGGGENDCGSLRECQEGVWVPTPQHPIGIRISWLTTIIGWCGLGRPTLRKEGITFFVSGLDNLYKAQAVLHSLGCFCRIFKAKRGIYGLEIPPVSLKQLMRLGLKVDGLTEADIADAGPYRISVASICPYHKCRQVYCFTEPLRHAGVFNGILTGNCGEQPLLPYEACNLGSINLLNHVKKSLNGYVVDEEKLNMTVQTAVRFLDDVIDVNQYPLPAIAEMTRSTRKIGLGVMGFADMLLKLGIPYNSQKAVDIAQHTMRLINNVAWHTSRQLAEKRGPFPAYSTQSRVPNGPTRNATVTTIAPTGTLSIIAGVSSGIEPVFAFTYIRNVMDNAHLVEVNPILEEMLCDRGLNTPELMREISEKGSLAHVDGIPEYIKQIFVCAHDVAPEWHVKMQAAFQQFTDNAVSKTVNFPNTATREDVAKVYRLAYEQGCKGVTIYRDGSRDSQVLNIGDVNDGIKDTPAYGTVLPRPRPAVTSGFTEKVKIGCGNLYISVNQDEQGICEVFTNTGRAGACPSQSEASARLVSVAIRSGMDPHEIINQLKGIRCPSCLRNEGVHVTSCPDAIARALEKALSGKDQPTSWLSTGPLTGKYKKTSPEMTATQSLHTKFCPECRSALTHEGGCVICQNCGFSKCG